LGVFLWLPQQMPQLVLGVIRPRKAPMYSHTTDLAQIELNTTITAQKVITILTQGRKVIRSLINLSIKNMKNKTFYLITLAQLITVWVFGIAGTIFSIITADEESDPFFGLLAISILFFLVFYTFGWRTNKKNNIND